MSMGCGFSSKPNNSNLNRAQALKEISDSSLTANFTQTYEVLDIRIYELESLCPGPRLAVVEAWIEYLREEFDSEEQVDTNSRDMTENWIPLEKSEPHDIAKLAVQLGIVMDSRKATQHENFFASLSDASKDIFSKQIYLEIMNSAKTRAKYLLEQYNLLSSLYYKQDSLIINGAIYYTELEETLDLQLEEARNIRDKLGSAMEQWRTCAFLLMTSVKSSFQAGEFWKQLKTKESPGERINLVLECRMAITASLISLQCAQLSLPHVELQQVSERQLSAVRHASKYMLTDSSQKIRFQHTLETLEKFHKNISELLTWFRETYETTLKQDFGEADKNVKNIANRLREHRMEVYSRNNNTKLTP